MDRFLSSGRPILGLSEVIFDLWEAKFDLWEARSGVRDPRSRVWVPRSEIRTLILTSKRPKSVVPRQISPLGERILTSQGGQNPVDLANFGVRRSPKGQFLGSQPGKGSRVVAPEGIGSPFLDPEGSANPEGPKNASPNLTQMWV